MKEIAPYDFGERKDFQKENPQAYHDRLDEKRYDISFEVTWTTETATALNPCTDESQPKNIFGEDGEYSGYNNRWLMVNTGDDKTKVKLAISPFTVKSAIANGFAAVMGGCLRVMDDHKISGHSDVKQGIYPYNGAWKRYRVARDGSSKPGIVLERRDEPDGSRYFKVEQVKEFYYDAPLLASRKWNRGDKVFITRLEDRRFKPPIIKGLSDRRLDPTDTEVEYHGPCEADMYTGMKHHQHRFIKRLPTVTEGVLRKEQFSTDAKDLKKIVYSGVHKNDMDHPKPWFQDLSKIDKTDFVYYETFDGKLLFIGKNFLFKALFYHPDTVPEGSEACSDMHLLCPRCAMFGMTNKEEKENEAVGFRGRFKSSALVCDDILEEDDKPEPKSIPVWEGEGTRKRLVYKDADLNLWRHNGNEVSCQLLLPILGPPKPNKPDVDSYFNKKTGKAKGAKRYKHGRMSLDDLKQLVSNTDRGEESQIADYAHQLRPCAQVCKEGLVFKGVLGAENCSVDEIASMIAILDTNTVGHGFKVGLGKSLGMGSIRSSIKKIWIRRPDDYQWHTNTLKELENTVSGISKEIQTLKTIQGHLNLLEEGWNKRTLRFPNAGLDYWKNFWNPAGPRAERERGNNNRGGSSGSGRSSSNRSSGGTSGEFRNTIRITPAKPDKR